MDQRVLTADHDSETDPADPSTPRTNSSSDRHVYYGYMSASPSVYSYLSEADTNNTQSSGRHDFDQGNIDDFNLSRSSSSSDVSTLGHAWSTASSGATMYAEALYIPYSDIEDSPRDSNVQQSREHMQNNNENAGNSQGLIRVEPFRPSSYRSSQALSEDFDLDHIPAPLIGPSALRSSQALSDEFDFEQAQSADAHVDFDSDRTSEEAWAKPKTPPSIAAPSLSRHSLSLDQDEARATTVMSPKTPRSRKRSPSKQVSSAEINARRSAISEDDALGGSPIASSDSQKKMNRKRTVSPGQPLSIVFGHPRQPSSRSTTSTNSQRSVGSDGHLLPDQTINGPKSSFVRRAGATTRTNNAFLAGLPKLPYFPDEQSPSRHDVRPGLITSLNSGDIERDIWGRQTAGTSRSWLVLVLFTFFPPLLLFLGAGYFDRVFGTIERRAKLAAFALTLIILSAGTALIIAFSISQW